MIFLGSQVLNDRWEAVLRIFFGAKCKQMLDAELSLQETTA
jgi:hypothetical protein